MQSSYLPCSGYLRTLFTNTFGNNMNSWEHWANYVLKDLDRIAEAQKQIMDDLTKVKIDVATLKQQKKTMQIDSTMLKLKTGMLGLGAGSIPSVVTMVVDMVK